MGLSGWTVRPPRRSAHAAVSSQPTARRPVDELTSWARVFGTRVVGVTLGDHGATPVPTATIVDNLYKLKDWLPGHSWAKGQ